MHPRFNIARWLPLAALGAGMALSAPAAAQEWRTLTSSRQLWDRHAARVEIEYGAGELRVVPAARTLLYHMEMRYDERQFSPVTEFDREARTLRLGTRATEGRRNGINVREGGHATISLTREIPLELELEFGAGEAQLELGGLRLQRLSVSTGASETSVSFDSPNPIAAERVEIKAGAAEVAVTGLGNTRAERFDFQGGVGATTLDFSGQWNHSTHASVKMGIGSLVLRLPRGLGVRVNRNSFLTSFDAEGLVRRGGSYFSGNWSTAPHKLTIDLDAALGSVEVEWVG